MIKAPLTLPASWYHDSGIHELERKKIFGREWIYAAHTSELRNPGDYLTVELAGYPLLLLRDQEGAVRCFHNVCRHRAAPLALDERGNLSSGRLVCRYHAWCYSLQGKLEKAPLFEQLEGVACEEFSLFGLQVAVHRGLIFVNMDPGAPPFSESFSQLIEEIERSGYPMEEYELHSKVTREGDFNWKVWVDGYQECYHCMTIHPIFNKDFALRAYQIKNKERYSVHSCERKIESSSGGFEGLWLWLYPNLGLPCYEPCFYTLQVNPLGPARTRLTYTFHFRPSVSAEKRADFLSFVEQITTEDVNICQSVYKNLLAGIYETGILNPDRENGVAYFHSLVRAALDTPAHRLGAGG